MAQAIDTMTTSELYDAMVARIDATPELDAHRAMLLNDWAEGDDHYRWAMTAPVAEIVDWAETLELAERS